MTSRFNDHFSGHAGDYSRFRPGYPEELYSWLTRQTAAHDLAWDCAAGSGQAAAALATHYQQVIASDASAEQVANADRGHANISYQTFPAEQTPLERASLDLITAAQALHRITPEVDRIIDSYYEKVVGPYWPPEHRMIETGYSDIAFPFDEIEVPRFPMQTAWTLPQLLGYIDIWSATKRYSKVNGQSPIPALHEQLLSECDEPETARTISWPLHIRVGRLS